MNINIDLGMNDNIISVLDGLERKDIDKLSVDTYVLYKSREVLVEKILGFEQFQSWWLESAWQVRYIFKGTDREVLRTHNRETGIGIDNHIHTGYTKHHLNDHCYMSVKYIKKKYSFNEPWIPKTICRDYFKHYVYGIWTYEVCVRSEAPSMRKLHNAPMTHHIRMYCSGFRNVLLENGSRRIAQSMIHKLKQFQTNQETVDWQASRQLTPAVDLKSHPPHASFSSEGQSSHAT